MKKSYVALSAFLFLTACSNKIDLETMSADELYNYAMDEMDKTRYSKAEAALETLETDHPYSQWAVRAKLMSAYAYYKDEKYDDAVMAVDRFIKYHPGNKDVPYALYLKGMCYYDQISSADKDQGNTRKAEETFALLATMYPDSEYAKDASGKMNLAEDYKAGQEMIIGRYYLREGNYLSALNRFSVVLENYQKTIQIEEALYRQVEIYAIFGLNNYANGYYKILKQNYPDGKWTAKAEKIMRKIGVETVPSKKDVEEAKEERKGWFSGWFGGSDDKAEEVQEDAAEQVTEVQAPVEEAKEERKGWFSGWFGGSDDKAEEVQENATEQVTEVQAPVEEAKEERKGWFSGWFGGNEDKAEEVQENATEQVTEVQAPVEEAKEERKGWFSGWFGGSDVSEEMAQSKKDANDTINESLNDMTEKSEQNVAEAENSAESKSSSWFGSLFGGGTLMDDDKAE